MGIFDTIKNIYNKVDSKVGGYLPGGQTPAQVSAPTTSYSDPANTPAAGPTSVLSQPVQQDIYGKVVNTAGSTTRGGSSPSQPAGITPQQIQAQQPQVQPSTSGSQGVSQPQTETKPKFTGGEIQPATSKQKFYMSPVGKFVSGFKNPVDTVKRNDGVAGDLGALSNIPLLFGGEIISGASKVLGITKALKASANARKAAATLELAEQSGTRIAAAGGLVKVGSKFGEAGKVVTNLKEATRINTFIMNTAAKLSPKNWKKLIGLGTGVVGTVGTLAGVSLWSGFGVRNSYSDGQQQLGIMISNAYKDGNIELGDELQELADDRTALYNELNPIWSNPLEAGKQIGVFVDTVKEANLKVKEDAMVKAEEQEAKDQLRQELQQRLLDGTAQPGDKEALNELNGGFQGNEDFENELESQVDTARLNQGNVIAQRIIDTQMTAEQIINDEEIRAFALDPNNQFSAVTKLYTEAITATGRGNFNGEDQGGLGGEIEPPSTLGFGLLQTGNEFKNNDEVTTDEQLVPEGSVNERALELYGLRYEQLTEEQKLTLQ